MGVGKSTVGKKLASKLGYEFIDTDKEFERKYKLGISNFFTKYNEELFRKLEYEFLESTFEMENTIISTGGGLPCNKDAIQKINENGISIFLEMNENAIYSRLANSKQKRPLVLKLSDEELMKFIVSKLKERIPFYEQAHITIPAISVEIDEILDKLKAFKAI